MTMRIERAVCTQPVRRGGTWDGWNEPCGRKVVSDDVCGVHLGQRNRAAAKRGARARAQAVADEIAALTGSSIAVRQEGGRWVGVFLIHLDGEL